MAKKLTTDEFIKKAKNVHGDEYDYLKTVYINDRTKLCIICRKHGEFWQNPGKHLKGSGCPECYGTHKKTTEEFINESKHIHGDKYNYEKTDYKTKRDKVCITCPVHGDFWVWPNNHLKGENKGGCPKCAIESRKKSLEEFIQQAKSVHGDKYDYSKVEYVNLRKNVCIICPEHGEFWQTPIGHLHGYGCRKCAQKKIVLLSSQTCEEFIEKSKRKHGSTYDYSLVEYLNSATKVKIICPIHGIFEQTPANHVAGQGCPKCAGKMLKTTEQFIEDAKRVHDDKYDYSRTIYVNSKTPIQIICKKHGEFWTTPNMHLKGRRCPKCAAEDNPIGVLSNKEEFVRKALLIHGYKYIYDKVEYIHSLHKVKVICPKHGSFDITPANHLSGHGCPKCQESGLERVVRVELEKRGLDYIYDKPQDWTERLKLDFYLPQFNAAIECQGIQHYEPLERYGGLSSFSKRIEYDKRKVRLCKENDVSLYYFINKKNHHYCEEAYVDVVKLIDDIINNVR